MGLAKNRLRKWYAKSLRQIAVVAVDAVSARRGRDDADGLTVHGSMNSTVCRSPSRRTTVYLAVRSGERPRLLASSDMPLCSRRAHVAVQDVDRILGERR